jgi:hypothetical protein
MSQYANPAVCQSLCVCRQCFAQLAQQVCTAASGGGSGRERTHATPAPPRCPSCKLPEDLFAKVVFMIGIVAGAGVFGGLGMLPFLTVPCWLIAAFVLLVGVYMVTT